MFIVYNTFDRLKLYRLTGYNASPRFDTDGRTVLGTDYVLNGTAILAADTPDATTGFAFQLEEARRLLTVPRKRLQIWTN